jgi:hypothetical protein
MSILSKVGHVFKVIFVDGDKVAVAVGPAIGFIFPGWGTLFNLVAGAVAKAESDFNPDGTVTGNGALKKAQVTESAQRLFVQYEKLSGNIVDQSAFIDGVVAAFNATKVSGES